jgi:hypothetical protein
MKKCFVILAYCNSIQKKEILDKNINYLKSSYPDIPLIVVSHYPVEFKTQFNIDYLIYDKSNPHPNDNILLCWDTYDKIKIINKNLDHGYTVLNQIKLGISFSKSLGLDECVFLNYDLNLNTDYLDPLLESSTNTFFDFSSTRGLLPTGFKLIAFKLKTQITPLITSLFTPQQYLKKDIKKVTEDFVKDSLINFIEFQTLPEDKFKITDSISEASKTHSYSLPPYIKEMFTCVEEHSKDLYLCSLLERNQISNLKILIDDSLVEYNNPPLNIITEKLPKTFNSIVLVELNGVSYNQLIFDSYGINNNTFIKFL